MEHAWLLPTAIFLPWAGALVVLAVSRAGRIRTALAIGFSAADALVTLALIPRATSATAFSVTIGGVFGSFSIVPDGLGVYLAVIAAVIGCLAIVFSVDYMRGEEGLARYYAEVLFFIGAMVGLVLSSNLLQVVVFWEITAFCSYALISFHNDDPKAVAGGIKALIVTGLGGVGLLAGAFLIFAQIGTFDIPTFISKASSLRPDILAWVAFGFLAAAAAKSAQFPFQTWLPDAMEAPTPISALIHAATMVNAGVYLLARFFPAFNGVPGWQVAVIAVGVLSALLGAVMAVASNDLKRLLAYSTVSQLGFMVYAIGAGGIFASLFHLMSHSVFKALLFLGAGAVIHSVGTRDMLEMGGLSRTMKVTCVVFILGALSLAGIPIMNGFWSKDMVLEAGLSGGPPGAYVVMVVTAGLTALYSARCVWLVFFAKPAKELHAHDAGPAMQVALLPLALGALVSWLLAGPFQALLARTIPSLGGTESPGTLALAREVLSSGATWMVLLVVLAGIGVWILWRRFAKPGKRLEAARRDAEGGLGFEVINRGITGVTQRVGESLRVTQSGILSWNMVGIVAAVVAVLIVLVVGG
ncbi:MAG TPA: proton-conducting transporter membrane subunit [Spirochaetia bacterium]|nr:proton-conducting transporter membrane subunit [Spirochaetia bacterium]